MLNISKSMEEEREMAARIKRFRERILPESFVELIKQQKKNKLKKLCSVDKTEE